MAASACLRLLALSAAVAPAALGDDSLVRALELSRRGKCAEAIPMFEALVRKQPRDVTLRKLLAKCLTTDNRATEARAQYNQVLAIQPTDLEAQTRLRPPTALTAPEPKTPAPAPPKTPGREWFERQKAGTPLISAERAIAAGQLAEAEQHLTALVAKDPELEVPQLRLAELYSRLKRTEDAAALYSAMASRFPKPEYLHRAAQNYGWAKRYPDAVALFRQYLTAVPGDHAARLSLANVLLWSNQLDAAATEYRAYLQASPADKQARLSLANALVWSEKFRDALPELQELARVQPDDRNTQVLLARSYAATSQPAMAMAVYDRWLARNPEDREFRENRETFMRDMPLQVAATLTARKDYDNAARFLEAHLKRSPDDADAVLQLARVYSWAQRYSQAAPLYERYVAQKPNDENGIRELGRVYLAQPDYPGARRVFSALIKSGAAKTEDREALVNAWVWAGEMKEGEADVRALLALDGNNETAFQALQAIREGERGEAVQAAGQLAANKQYKQAIAAWQEMTQKYGADREAELTLARLYNWDKQYAKAAVAYRAYLSRYGNDDAARLELANLQSWSQKYEAAEQEYSALLNRNPRNAEALFGMASLSDYRGDDRFRVYREYQNVVKLDPGNTNARQRLQELGPLVSPYAGWQQRGFSDSDGFGRSINTLEASFPFTAGLRISPFYRYGYFTQSRQVGGAECGVVGSDTDPNVRSLNRQICGANGTLTGSGGGIRLDLRPATAVQFTGEIGALRFAKTARNSLNYSGQLQFRSGDSSVALSLMRRDAVYDVNTAASLFAGIMADTAMFSYQQEMGENTRFWLAAAATRYSSGIGFNRNTQRRIGAVLDHEVVKDFRAGFFVRATDFAAPSRLYFSPSFYGTGGFQYAWRTEVANGFRMAFDGELGYGRILRHQLAGVNVLELSVFPSMEWRVRPDLLLRFGYRFARGQSSSFGSPAYRSSGFDFGVQNSFMPMLPEPQRSPIEIR